ncbi:natterin-3-like [Gastrophryne carolinensis]
MAYIFITMNCVLVLVNSLAIPPSDEKSAPKISAPLNGSSIEPAVLKWHNADLSKASKPEVRAADMEEIASDPQEIEMEEDKPSMHKSRQIIYNGHESLQWVDWAGSIPAGAVSIYNSFTSRTDYVCSVANCATGFYSTNKGAYCYYANGEQEFRASIFKILVNDQNFEYIQWLPGSYGSVPPNPVSRCSGVFVGKNQYGLGKVVPSSSVLALPYNGNAYTYDMYEVLNLNTNYHTQTLTGFSYNSNQATFYQEGVQVLTSLKVFNNACQRISKTVTLSKTILVEKYWNTGRSTKNGVSTMITCSIPSISGTSVSFPSAVQFEWQDGSPHTESRTLSRSLSVTVNPQHECEVVLEGRNVHTEIPFSSSLTRFFQNAESHSVNIKGIFSNAQIDYVTISLGQCKRIANAPPC